MTTLHRDEPERGFGCAECERAIDGPDALADHIATVHGIPDEE